MADSVREKILRRMVRHRWIGAKHADIGNLRKGFSRSSYREVEDEVDAMVREGLIVVKPAFYGTQVSLNPNMLNEVRRILGL